MVKSFYFVNQYLQYTSVQNVYPYFILTNMTKKMKTNAIIINPYVYAKLCIKYCSIRTRNCQMSQPCN